MTIGIRRLAALAGSARQADRPGRRAARSSRGADRSARPVLEAIRGALASHRSRLWLRRIVRRTWLALAALAIVEAVLWTVARFVPLEAAPVVAVAIPILVALILIVALVQPVHRSVRRHSRSMSRAASATGCRRRWSWRSRTPTRRRRHPTTSISTRPLPRSTRRPRPIDRPSTASRRALDAACRAGDVQAALLAQPRRSGADCGRRARAGPRAAEPTGRRARPATRRPEGRRAPGRAPRCDRSRPAGRRSDRRRSADSPG